MLCANFGRNWPGGPREEDENVKRLQWDTQTEGQRTTGQQTSSLELSAEAREKTPNILLIHVLVFSLE